MALATYGASQGAEQGWLTAASLPWWVLGLLLLLASMAGGRSDWPACQVHHRR